MRQAPPVGVSCTGGMRWRAMQAFLPAAAAGALCAWLLQHAGLPAAWAWPVIVAIAALAWWRARPRDVQLRWDGQRWQAEGKAGGVDVMLDVAGLMLLRWRPDPGDQAATGWIAVCRTDAGPSWPALRAALYSPAATGTADLQAPE